MKECSKCKETKDLDCFSPHPTGKFGKQSRCKKCFAKSAQEKRDNNPGYAAQVQKKYREKNPEKIKAYNKSIWLDPIKKEKSKAVLKEWKLKNPNHYRKWYWTNEEARQKKIESHKKWLEKNKDYAKKNLLIQKERYPEKHRARYLLRKSVYEGKTIKPQNCEYCMKIEKRIEGHHEDYSKPLCVVWLCVSCHKSLHKKEVHT